MNQDYQTFNYHDYQGLQNLLVIPRTSESFIDVLNKDHLIHSTLNENLKEHLAVFKLYKRNVIGGIVKFYSYVVRSYELDKKLWIYYYRRRLFILCLLSYPSFWCLFLT